MKTKKLLKKLKVNKETIANMSDNEMNSVYGGTSLPTFNCTIPGELCEVSRLCETLEYITCQCL